MWCKSTRHATVLILVDAKKNISHNLWERSPSETRTLEKTRSVWMEMHNGRAWPETGSCQTKGLLLYCRNISCAFSRHGSIWNYKHVPWGANGSGPSFRKTTLTIIQYIRVLTPTQVIQQCFSWFMQRKILSIQITFWEKRCFCFYENISHGNASQVSFNYI